MTVFLIKLRLSTIFDLISINSSSNVDVEGVFTEVLMGVLTYVLVFELDSELKVDEEIITADGSLLDKNSPLIEKLSEKSM